MLESIPLLNNFDFLAAIQPLAQWRGIAAVFVHLGYLLLWVDLFKRFLNLRGPAGGSSTPVGDLQ